jgi:hypothetical protein
MSRFLKEKFIPDSLGLQITNFSVHDVRIVQIVSVKIIEEDAFRVGLCELFVVILNAFTDANAYLMSINQKKLNQSEFRHVK